VPHHLIDIIDPLDAYSVAQFRKDTLRLVEEINARGKLPLLVGGTMLYFKVWPMAWMTCPAPIPVRAASMKKRPVSAGPPCTRAWPPSIRKRRRLAPADSQRIQRALEIYTLSGKPMSELLAQREKTELPFELLSFALEPSDRAVLHDASRAASTSCCRQPARQSDHGSGSPAQARRPASRPAVDPLRRLPPGLGIPRRQHRLRHHARNRHHRHAPAGQAPADLAALHAGARGARLPGPDPAGAMLAQIAERLG
jgi:tRNA dimethylallyltransferase